MITILYLCGIVFAICVYRGSQTKIAEGLSAVSSAFASASSHPFIIDQIIPTPVPAADPFCLSSLLSIYGRKVQDSPVFPALNSLTHGLCGQKSASPGIIIHSLQKKNSGAKEYQEL